MCGARSRKVNPMAQAYSVGILKGGVGKSTLGINLSDRLGERGDVLFCDFDPNGHATEGIGLGDIYTERSQTIADVFYRDTPIDDLIVETPWFDVLPSSENLEDAELKMQNDSFGVTRIRKEIIDELLGDRYDYIVTDSPAYRGPLSDGALVGTGKVIIPLTARSEAISGFQKTIDAQIRTLQEEIGLEIAAIVPNMFDSSSRNEQELIEDLNAEFPSLLPPFAQLDMLETSPGPGIRERIDFTRAYDHGQPLSEYAPDNSEVERLDQLVEFVLN